MNTIDPYKAAFEQIVRKLCILGYEEVLARQFEPHEIVPLIEALVEHKLKPPPPPTVIPANFVLPQFTDFDAHRESMSAMALRHSETGMHGFCMGARWYQRMVVRANGGQGVHTPPGPGFIPPM